MKLSINKIIRPRALLVVVFTLVICYEVFVLYHQVYQSLSTEIDEVPDQNVVRVDLKSYGKTLELLDAAVIFAPSVWNLINLNPFK